MVQGSILLSVSIYGALAFRRSYLEDYSGKSTGSNFSPIPFFSLMYYLLACAMSITFGWNKYLTIIFTLFFILQLFLEQLRYQYKYLFFFGINLLQVLSLLILAKWNNIIEPFTFIVIVISVPYIAIKYLNQNYIVYLKSYKHILNYPKLFDFILTSTVGFISPLIIFSILGSTSLIEFRTAQNFLSISNLLTFTIYNHYHFMDKPINLIRLLTASLIPSIFLLTLLVIGLSAFPELFTTLVGPEFVNIWPLILLLICSLIPSVANSLISIGFNKKGLMIKFVKIRAIVSSIQLIYMAFFLKLFDLPAYIIFSLILEICSMILLFVKYRKFVF